MEIVKSFNLTEICLLLFTASCASLSMTTSPSSNSLRFLALGDSYTIGESVAENLRWPVQLVARLRDLGIPMADAEIIARTGWTTDELQEAIADQYGPSAYDLVSVLIGVNDQYRSYPIEEYRADFKELLAFAISAANGADPQRVIVLSIPDWGVTPYAEGQDRQQVAAQIDAFNAVNREESAAAGVHYFDITSISRQAASDPTLIAGDGLHPSGKMYTLWVELIFPDVYALLATAE